MTKRKAIVAAVVLGLALSAPAFANDATPAKKADAAVKVDAKATATSQPAADVKMPDQVPKDAGEAIDKGKEIIEFAKAKNWWGMSAAIIWLLMFVLKLVGLFKKIGKRWAYIIVPVLSVAAMLLSKFAGDLSWGAAVAVLTSGPTAALLNDFVKRGILNKEPSTPMNGGGA